MNLNFSTILSRKKQIQIILHETNGEDRLEKSIKERRNGKRSKWASVNKEN